LTVTWPREHFQPIEFHGMDLGPFSMSVTIQRGETPEEAHDRGMRRLGHMADDLFPRKLEAYLDRVGSVDKAVRKRARRHD
jgi:hypothetical protein